MVQLFYNQYTTKYITLYYKNNTLYCVKGSFLTTKPKFLCFINGIITFL